MKPWGDLELGEKLRSQKSAGAMNTGDFFVSHFYRKQLRTACLASLLAVSEFCNPVCSVRLNTLCHSQK